ncbi:MAG: hypothetical protein EBR01_03125 [Proteobacteria bacterium]|nr:hypothetical protein [Pseudomonadota bacterium]NBY21102.1 hypothetical protein [bacterium]
MAALATKEISPVLEIPRKPKYNFLQRFALRRAHPRRVFFDVAALPWEVFYLWNGRWGVALTLFIMTSVVSMIAASDADYEKISETVLGKIALLHLLPVNMFFQLSGLVFLVQGLISHNTQSMLLGSSFVFIGHMAGWGKVHRALETRP